MKFAQTWNLLKLKFVQKIETMHEARTYAIFKLL